MIKIPHRTIAHTEIQVYKTFYNENIILKLRNMAHITHTQKEPCEMQCSEYTVHSNDTLNGRHR